MKVYCIRHYVEYEIHDIISIHATREGAIGFLIGLAAERGIKKPNKDGSLSDDYACNWDIEEWEVLP